MVHVHVSCLHSSVHHTNREVVRQHKLQTDPLHHLLTLVHLLALHLHHTPVLHMDFNNADNGLCVCRTCIALLSAHSSVIAQNEHNFIDIDDE